MGYDGLELACWGDHFDVDAAAGSARYRREKWDLLEAHGLNCYAISNHLVGQAVCDLIDERHQAILPPDVWGDGKPEGVRRRAARKLVKTGKAARAFFDAKPGGVPGPAVVAGFTGSSIWHSIYAFPPTSASLLASAASSDFATRFGPDSRRLRRARRQLCARGASDRDRVRYRHRRCGRSQRSAGIKPLRLQLRPVPPRLPGCRLRRLHARVRHRAFSTLT